MKVAFGGDVFLGGDLKEADAGPPVRCSSFSAADLRVVNLEHPISAAPDFAAKSTLHAGPWALPWLKQLGADAVSLANNHVHDKQDAGILDTLSALDALGIGRFGAGRDLAEARSPHWLRPGLAVLSYCTFDKPYLDSVQVATETAPGVAPLRADTILADLDALPAGSRAIVFLHWGREHVWLPPAGDLALARRLLAHPRVALVVGNHAHRPQGWIEHGGKRAYMCLGNLLFPNFHVEPPCRLVYPAAEARKGCRVTRDYHRVGALTHKKWRAVNRVSLLVTWDDEAGRASHQLALQDDDDPVVRDFDGIANRLMLVWLAVLSLAYRLPPPMYGLLERVNTLWSFGMGAVRILLFQARQNGLAWVANHAAGVVRRRSARLFRKIAALVR